jgi:hypothetical protein
MGASREWVIRGYPKGCMWATRAEIVDGVDLVDGVDVVDSSKRVERLPHGVYSVYSVHLSPLSLRRCRPFAFAIYSGESDPAFFFSDPEE